MVRLPHSSRSLKCWMGPRFRSLFSRCYGVEHHFIGLLEKVHGPPKYPKTRRLQVAVKILPGIPFFKRKSRFSSSILRQKSQRRHPFSVRMGPIREAIVWDSSLRFSGRTFIRMMTRIMQMVVASGLPRSGKGKNLESSYNNSGLDEWGKSVGKGETIGLASRFGGTSIY